MTQTLRVPSLVVRALVLAVRARTRLRRHVQRLRYEAALVRGAFVLLVRMIEDPDGVASGAAAAAGGSGRDAVSPRRPACAQQGDGSRCDPPPPPSE